MRADERGGCASASWTFAGDGAEAAAIEAREPNDLWTADF
jgi:hypothetical protein